MPVKSSIKGLGKLLVQFRELGRKLTDRTRVSVIVGYTASYALVVHEDLTAFHPVGQAKYLEEPFRNLRKELADIVNRSMARGADLPNSLLLAGLYLQRESQKLVPVDTGALKNSAFTRRDS